MVFKTINIALLSTLLISSVMSRMIVPDLNNAFQPSLNDAETNGKSFVFKFTLPSTSKGLSMGGVVGVDFSNADSASTAILFNNLNFTCALIEIGTNTTTTFTVRNGNLTTNSPIANCQLNDTLTTRRLVANGSYQLTITPSFSFTTRGLNTIALFTATAPDDTRVYVDSNKVFASGYLYPSFFGAFTNPLVINSQDNLVKVTAGSATEGTSDPGDKIYPGDTFYTIFSFTSNSRIPSDYDFVIEFDSNFFGSFSTVESIDFVTGTTDISKQKLVGDLSVETVAAGKTRITGIIEDIVPGRQFKLKLNNWTAKKVSNGPTKLALAVYYRNSHTLYSYSSNTFYMSVNEVLFKNIVFRSDDHHKWLATGMTWPLRIALTPNVTMSNVHVVITNAEASKIGFNAASCNFYDNTTLNTAFNTHPICHSTHSGDASGFSFYLATMTKDVSFTFSILTHLNLCGTSNDSNVYAANNSSKLKINIKIYSKNTMSTAGTNGFSELLTNTTSQDSEFSCSAAYYGARPWHSPFPPAADEANGTKVYFLAREINELQVHKITLNSNVFVWDMDSNVETGIKDSTNTLVYDNSVNKTAQITIATNTRLYLFTSTTANKIDDQYVSLLATIRPAIGAAVAPNLFIPGDFLFVAAIDATSARLQNHYLEISWQKKWFTKGTVAQSITTAAFNELCYTSWDVTYGAKINFSYTLDLGANSTPDTTAKNTAAKNIAATNIAIGTQKNIFHQGDSGKTNISSMQLPSPDDTFANYFIKGIIGVNASDHVSYRFPCFDVNCTLANSASITYFGFFTTCMKWKTGISSKSILDNVEVLFTLKDTVNDRPSRMIRLISYLPMEGIFKENFAVSNSDNNFSNTTYNGPADIANGYSGVCVTAISTKTYSVTTASIGGNTFVLFMQNIALFNTDYSSYTNDYPIPNLKGGIKAYARSTASPYDENNIRHTSTYLSSANFDNDYRQMELSDPFTLGSQLWFNSSSDSTLVNFENSNAVDLLVPHYCMNNPSTNESNILIAGIWATSGHYNTVAAVNVKNKTSQNHKYHLTSNANIAKPATFNNTYCFLRINYSAFNATSFSLVADPNSHQMTTPVVINNVTFIGALFSDKIAVASTATVSNLGTGKTRISDSSISFYFNGSKFNKVLVGIFQNSIKVFDNVATDDVAFTISGVSRPDLSSIIQADSTFILRNNIVVTGANRIQLASNLNNKIALVSLTKNAYNWTITYSSPESAYYRSVGKINLTIANPSSSTTDNLTFPIGTPITFGILSTLVNTAFCAINSDATNTATACIYNETSSRFTCKSPIASSSFSICCFNVNLLDTTSNLVLNNINIDLTDTANNFYNYLMFEKTDNFSTGLSITTTALQGPELTSISYLHSNTLGGITNARLVVNLKKGIEYDSQIIISGNFSSLQNYDQEPSCVATVSADGEIGSWDTGDNLIKSCKIMNMGTAEGQIIITTKRVIHKCNQENSNTLYISLSPVKVANLSANLYKTSLTYASGTSYFNPTTGKSISSSFTNSKVYVVDTTNTTFNLCSINSIFPRIVGAASDYEFRINYTTAHQSFVDANKWPNEISIFLPFNQFQDIDGLDLYCSSSITNGPVACNYSNKAININFQKRDIKVTAVNEIYSFTVTVHNLKNTKVEDGSLKYSCTLNDVSFKNERTVLAVGRGSFAGSIGVVKTNGFGILSFDNSVKSINTANNPRTQSTNFEFGLILDKAGVHNPTDITIDKDPLFIVEFPSSFAISKYNNSDMSSKATIELKSIEQDSSKTVFTLLGEKVIANGNATVNGNTLSIRLNSNVVDQPSQFKLSKFIEYFIVRVSSVRTPEDEYETSGILNCYIVNSDYTYVYRTYTNTNNMYTSRILANTTLLSYYRGFKFDWDQRNWVIDIYNNVTNYSTNFININAGFYTNIVAAIKDFTNLKPYSSKATISFDQSFTHKIRGDELIVQGNTVTLYSIENRAEFSIGIPCQTPVGRYLVKVITSGEDSAGRRFISESAIIFNVSYKVESVLCTLPTNLTPKDGGAPFKCVVPEVYDDYDLAFKNINIDDNFSNAKVEFSKNGFIATGEFSTNFTANKDTTSTITFSAVTGNICLNFSSISDTSNFTFSLENRSLPNLNDTDFDSFYFSTRLEDNTLEYDEIELFYSTPEYSRLACVITCTSLNFPSELEVKTQENLVSSEKINFFKDYSVSSTEIKSTVIGGLRRQTNYKILCYLYTTSSTGESSSIQREFTTMNKSLNATETSLITLEPTLYTKCAQFNFKVVAEDPIKQRLVNYCQNLFSINNGITTGCIVCSDIDRQFFSVGSALSDFTCLANTEKVNNGLRMLQDANETVNQIGSSYIVCATQDLVCDSAQLNSTTYGNMIIQYIADLGSANINGLINSSQTNDAKATDVVLISTETIDDEVMPTLEVCSAGDNNINEGCIYLTKNNIEYLGKVEADIIIRSNMKCSWKVLPKAALTPTQSEIQNCDNKRCGSFYSYNNRVTQVRVPEGIKLVRGETFAFYFTCPSHNVINARRLSEQVIILFEKTIPLLDKVCPKKDLDINPDEEGCKCLSEDKIVIDQGADGSLCSSTYLTSLIIALSGLLCLLA